jgi:hypothetical protein
MGSAFEALTCWKAASQLVLPLGLYWLVRYGSNVLVIVAGVTGV